MVVCWCAALRQLWSPDRVGSAAIGVSGRLRPDRAGTLGAEVRRLSFIRLETAGVETRVDEEGDEMLPPDEQATDVSSESLSARVLMAVAGMWQRRVVEDWSAGDRGCAGGCDVFG